MPAIFVTGPARSGKSRLALRMAKQYSGDVCYVATARCDLGDAQWTARIERHRAQRPASWRTLETADGPVQALTDLLRSAVPRQAIVVDSLGTWLSAQLPLLDERSDLPAVESALLAQGNALVDEIVASAATTIVVSEETGWGVVPEYPAARVFRDVLGWINQSLAQRAGEAYLVVCGHAVDLKTAVPIEAWSTND